MAYIVFIWHSFVHFVRLFLFSCIDLVFETFLFLNFYSLFATSQPLYLVGCSSPPFTMLLIFRFLTILWHMFSLFFKCKVLTLVLHLWVSSPALCNSENWYSSVINSIYDSTPYTMKGSGIDSFLFVLLVKILILGTLKKWRKSLRHSFCFWYVIFYLDPFRFYGKFFFVGVIFSLWWQRICSLWYRDTGIYLFSTQLRNEDNLFSNILSVLFNFVNVFYRSTVALTSWSFLLLASFTRYRSILDAICWLHYSNN